MLKEPDEINFNSIFKLNISKYYHFYVISIQIIDKTCLILFSMCLKLDYVFFWNIAHIQYYDSSGVLYNDLIFAKLWNDHAVYSNHLFTHKVITVFLTTFLMLYVTHHKLFIIQLEVYAS